jgi:hypothetical protein
MGGGRLTAETLTGRLALAVGRSATVEDVPHDTFSVGGLSLEVDPRYPAIEVTECFSQLSLFVGQTSGVCCRTGRTRCNSIGVVVHNTRICDWFYR